MKKIISERFKDYIEWAGQNTSNRIYPLSIAEGFQTGDIYVDNAVRPEAVLFWHYCGFAYLSGRPGEGFLTEIYNNFITAITDRRFLLITDDSDIIRFFSEKPDIALGRRIEYILEDTGRISEMPPHPECSIRQIDSSLLTGISGRIIPAFSWKYNEQFNKNGFGYALITDGTIASVAFSAAVSSEETDIGVETDEKYRGRGYASMLAARMCRDIIASGKRPVWAHAEQNIASMRTAAACGFTKQKINTVIRLAEPGI